jgi:phospholipid/cholesterol/gamma-HCH transport system permease protein
VADAAAQASLQVEPGPDGTLRLRLGGRLDAMTLPAIWTPAVRAVEGSRAALVELQAAEVTYCDAVGAALLVRLRDLQEQRGGSIRLLDFPEDYQPVADLLLRPHPRPRPVPVRLSWVEHVGRAAAGVGRDLAELIAWIGELLAALCQALVRPQKVRWRDTFRTLQTAGVESLPVVLLVAGLIGLVLGFQSAVQLRRFGGDIFLANLIGLSMVRELGPLMTAVVLAARSGSAFAAEIGTMQINEEVDALRTMGIDPTRFLVTPRMLAALVATPLLTMFANLAGIAGGAVVWSVTLGMSPAGYAAQLEQAIRLNDLLGGLFKALVFGILVAGVGCVRGMQTRGGASAVGHSTTSAVVSGVVLIAVTDSLFSIAFYHLGI